MGVFDLLTPVLLWVDESVFSFVSIDIKIIVWALLGAVCSTLVFKSLINTKKITVLKSEIKVNQRALNNHDGDFSELKSLAKNTIALSLNRLGLTTLPSLAAAIPLVFLLVFMSHNYDFETPIPSQVINYQVTSLLEQDSNLYASVIWPASGQKTSINDSVGNNLVDLPIKPVNLIHKKQWWNVLFANPAGYIPETSQVTAVVFEFKSIPLGPIFKPFFSSWHWPFIISLSFFSVACFIFFKVKF